MPTILRTGNKRIAHSKNKNLFLSFLSAIRCPLFGGKSAIRSSVSAQKGRASLETIERLGRSTMFLSGFTLIEVMVATAILSFGIVLVYESFFRLLGAFDYYVNYLNIAPFANEKMWQAQDALRRLGAGAQIETNGQFAEKNKDFAWSLSCGLTDGANQDSLYKIDLVIEWAEGKRTEKLLRSGYAIHKEKE